MKVEQDLARERVEAGEVGDGGSTPDRVTGCGLGNNMVCSGTHKHARISDNAVEGWV